MSKESEMSEELQSGGEQQGSPPRAGATRPVEGRFLSGVAAAIAPRIGCPTTLLRVLWALLVLGLPGGAVLYVMTGAAAASIALSAVGALAHALYVFLCFVIPDPRQARLKNFRWDFGSSSGVVLLAMLIGGVVLTMFAPYWEAYELAMQESSPFVAAFKTPGVYQSTAGFGLGDVLFGGFLVSALVYLWIQRYALKAFFRSMYTGVSIVTFSLVAIGGGVLVPQIAGFEKPEQRVTAQNYEEQYAAFRWAEGYFIYHMLHLYGIGMPEEPLDARVLESLDRFGRAYGYEERDNRKKQMQAAFDGRVKTEEIRAWIMEHDEELRRFFDVSTLLHLNRAYKADWFTALMCLLFCAIFTNTLKNGLAVFNIQKLGFFVVHVGMLILLIGGGCSKATTERGILHLDLRDGPKDTFWSHHDPDDLMQLPFAVKLDHFARHDWKALEVHFPEEEFRSLPPTYTLWPDRKIDLDYYTDDAGVERPALRLRALEIHDRAHVGTPHVREAPKDAQVDSIPLVELEVPNVHLPHPGHSDDEHIEPFQRRLLSPELRDDAYYGESFRLRVAYSESGDSGLPAFPDDETLLGGLWVEMANVGSGMPVRHPLRIGERVPVVGGFELEVTRVTKNFQLDGPGGQPVHDPRPLAEQPYAIAAIWLDVYPPGDAEPERDRLVFEQLDPVDYGYQSRFEFDELVVRFRWDPWTAPGPPRSILHWGADREPELVRDDGTSRPVAPGDTLAMGAGEEVRALQFLHRADVEKNIEFLPDRIGEDGWDMDFYAQDPRGLLLEVTRWPDTDRETSEVVVMATTEGGNANLHIADDRRFVVRFFENTSGFPFEWRSVLSIVETDGRGQPYVVPLGSERDREIRVNDYFEYKNYKFFQTNAIPELPTYSGVGVVYDRGILPVLIGMYTIIAGSVIAFLVRPIVLAIRRKKKEAAA